jgi:hypothetical protein
MPSSSGSGAALLVSGSGHGAAGGASDVVFVDGVLFCLLGSVSAGGCGPAVLEFSGAARRLLGLVDAAGAGAAC